MTKRLTSALFVILLTVFGVSRCNNSVITVEAQSLPITVTACWDLDDPTFNVTNYIVQVDNVTVNTVDGATNCSPVTFTTLGTHTIGAAAVSIFGQSGFAKLTANVVVPPDPKNPRLKK